MGLLAPGDNGASYDQTRGASVRTRGAGSDPGHLGQGRRLRIRSGPAVHHPRPGYGARRFLSRFTNHLVNAAGASPTAGGAVGVVGTHPEADRHLVYSRHVARSQGTGFSYPEGLQLIAALMRL